MFEFACWLIDYLREFEMRTEPPSPLEIDVPCSNCGTKTRKAVAWLRSNEEFVCHSCGTIIDQCTQLAIEFDRTTRLR